MKTKVQIALLILIMSVSLASTPHKTFAQGVSVSFQLFYDELSPFGSWVENPQYGYVWVPNVEPGFVPYSTNGYWLLTEDGWTWVSNYSWGWAPFHYGRWFYDDVYGPMWVPDYDWSPGWVVWRKSANYYGWAPMGPGINIDIAYTNAFNLPYNRWTFVRSVDFGRRDLHRYYVHNSYNVNIYRHTDYIHNFRDDRMHKYRYCNGPDRFEAEHRSGRKYAPYTIRDANKPYQNIGVNHYELYRPEFRRENPGDNRPTPGHVDRLDNLKNPSHRNYDNNNHNQNQDMHNRQQNNQQNNYRKDNRQQDPHNSNQGSNLHRDNNQGTNMHKNDNQQNWQNQQNNNRQNNSNQQGDNRYNNRQQPNRQDHSNTNQHDQRQKPSNQNSNNENHRHR